MKAKPVLYVIVNNHFDPTWRRCWDRRFTFKGRQFASYADIQDYYMTDNLALARRHQEYRFSAESTLVVRHYVRRHPERLAELRRLAAEGRFAVTGAGDNIVDSNMILGESLVRNFVTGLLWVEDHLGVRTRLGVRNDAFGNSAQVPQIFRGCEIAWAMHFFYTPVAGRFWRGLDGSVLCTAELPVVAMGGGCDKYAPCPACDGAGCRACAGRGIDPALRSRLAGAIDDKTLAAAGAGIVHMGPEELLPNMDLAAWARRMRGRYDVRIAIEEDMRPEVQKWIDQVDSPPAAEVHPSVEANPNNSGVLVTRIRCKQTVRRQEYALLGAETLATLASLAGAAYPRRALAGAWQTLLFTMFHDAITSTHIDPAYEELKDMAAGLDKATTRIRGAALKALVRPKAGTVSVINPFGNAATQVVTATVRARSANVAVRDAQGRAADVVACEKAGGGRVEVSFIARGVAPLSARTYRVVPRGGPAPAVRTLRRPVIENQRFRVTADERGIVAIYDKRLGAEVSRAAAYRPNEMILERDEGSPWATLHPDRTRYPLAAHTRLVAAEKGAAFQRLTFECAAPDKRLTQGDGYGCRTRITLYRGIDRVDFVTDATWDTYNYRIRVAMPVARRGRGVYGIPYGMLARPEYEPQFEHWAAANGDWPAVNWAGVESRGRSVALLNKGLPAYCVETGPKGGQTILLSILRSPVVPTYLHEPYYYTMTEFDGMRDAGRHHFEYALAAYDVPFAESTVVADAEGYNAGLLVAPGEARLPEGPRVRSDHVRLAAMKRAEKGKALILRLVEFRGRAGEAEVALPWPVRGAAKVNLLEREARPLAVTGGRVRVPVRGWEIATLRVEV
ncbi:MAG: hypothetical protein IMZ66_08660 [Planctomycetes bacterium]|nr:hypothetical protein [Planctomycetota bacterium]